MENVWIYFLFPQSLSKICMYFFDQVAKDVKSVLKHIFGILGHFVKKVHTDF